MSLFPAYSTNSTNSNNPQSNTDKEWLENNSFAVRVPLSEPPKEKEVDCFFRESTSNLKKKKKDKKKHKKKDRSVTADTRETQKQEIEIEDSDDFIIDKERQISYLSVKTLTRPLKPRYNLLYSGLLPKYFVNRKKKRKRYYKHVDLSEGCKEGTLEEESLVSKKTENFNKILADDPHDIASWIEFVNFQDEYYKYQHIKYKTAIDRERAADQHKLSILDKAVAQNPENKDLQTLWLKIGTKVLPSEEMSSRIDEILEESGGTMILWLGLMTTTQHSLARCTIPAVTQLYEKLLLNFQNVKKHDLLGRDLNVLELLFHYGRFLDQCGHWEILWTMIKVNLQFNVKVNLSLNLVVEDEKVKQLENIVLEKEKQGIWQLWSQLERIREGLHFLPVSNSIDYPQRCVSMDNIVNFTWHFHPDLHFQLIVCFIVLLKVPLLQATNTTLKLLIPNSLPWVFDSPEFILSSVLAFPAVNLQYNYLYPVAQLSRGPQYLRKLNGQIEFLNLISQTFEACLTCLEGTQKAAVGVWWLRFERWIHLLNKHGLCSLPEERRKAKTFFKDFLKMKENRDNLLYYIEYSLFEFNQGNTDMCIKTLKTLISSRPPVLDLDNHQERGILASVYRNLCEVLIGLGQQKEALDILIILGSGSPPESKITIHLLSSAEKKFGHISNELINELNSYTSCSLEYFLMPLFVADWISCYFWFIALLKTPSDLRECSEKIFTSLENLDGVMTEQTRECLSETLITISWVLERNNLSHIKDTLQKSFSNYPQNLRILSFMVNNELQNNKLWWTLKKTFLSPPTIFGCICLSCVALEKFQNNKENFQHRVKNLLQNLALHEGKLSSIVHCLRLRFLYEYENSALDVAQLQALESCPWNKSIYMESILLLPAKLMQLTDVLIEKDLRIHITPDEIQEMRD